MAENNPENKSGNMKGASYIRSTLFNVAFFIAHVLTVVVMGLFAWLPQKCVVWMLETTMHIYAWTERTFLGLRYEVTGLENLPPQGTPYIFASKHQSIWETYILHILIRNPAVIMKKELMQIPVWGTLARKVDAIGVDRGAGGAAIKSLIRGGRVAKEQGRAIVIFPQGTRLPPEEHRPYKQGVSVLYDSLKIPVVPVALNSGMYWPKGGFLKRGGTIKVEILPAIPAGMKGADMLALLEAQLEPVTQRLVADAKRELGL